MTLDDDPWHIGDVVRKVRLKKGWTAKQLAEAAGIRAQLLREHERDGQFTSHALDLLAAALGVTVRDLYLILPEQNSARADIWQKLG